MVPYAVTLAFGLGAVAASAPSHAMPCCPTPFWLTPLSFADQGSQGLDGAAGVSLLMVAALLGSSLAVTINFSIARTKARCRPIQINTAAVC